MAHSRRRPYGQNHSAIVYDAFRSLVENQAVKFEVAQGPKGPQAQNVVESQSET